MASNEWYTPKFIIDAVLAVLEEIDLDPCSNGLGTIPAKTHYTIKDDGLGLDWAGSAFVNPPYGPAGTIGRWVDKIIKEFTEGILVECILLVPASTDTKWFQKLSTMGFPWCAIDGRVKFWNPDPGQRQNGPSYSSAVFYIGPRLGRFIKEFSNIGRVYQHVKA